LLIVRLRFSIFLAAALVVVVSVAGDGGPRPRPSTLQLTPCAFGPVAARCGTLSVPENRATSKGRAIALRIVVVAALIESARPDPIFWLAGGPGVAATDDAPAAVRFLQGPTWSAISSSSTSAAPVGRTVWPAPRAPTRPAGPTRCVRASPTCPVTPAPTRRC